eukprot:2757596-Pleurochrysis_carterae.AAC.1
MLRAMRAAPSPCVLIDFGRSLPQLRALEQGAALACVLRLPGDASGGTRMMEAEAEGRSVVVHAVAVGKSDTAVEEVEVTETVEAVEAMETVEAVEEVEAKAVEAAAATVAAVLARQAGSIREAEHETSDGLHMPRRLPGAESAAALVPTLEENNEYTPKSEFDLAAEVVASAVQRALTTT